MGTLAVSLLALTGCGGPDLPEPTRAGVLSAEDLPAEPTSGEVDRFASAGTGPCPFGTLSLLDAPTFDPDREVIVYQGVESNEVISGSFTGTTNDVDEVMAGLESDLEDCQERAPGDVSPLDLGGSGIGWTVPQTLGGGSGATAVAVAGRTVVAVTVRAGGDAEALDVEPLIDRAIELAEAG